MVICTLCGKELEGTEAKTIKVIVGDDEYYSFNLCHRHWEPLCKRLSEIHRSTQPQRR